MWSSYYSCRRLIIIYFSYYNPLKRGVRIASKSKINDSILTGLRMVDPSLSIGRGQRQLIPGDRYTGKTPIIINIISSNNIFTKLRIKHVKYE